MKKQYLFLITFLVAFNSNGYATCCNPDDAEKIIKQYDLKPAASEGGYYKLTYKLDDPASDIPKATAIYYFLKKEDKSLFHKLNSDIIYHFYAGDPVTLIQLKPDGTGSTTILGNDIFNNQVPQVIVNQNTWMGAFVIKGGCYALMGTTMTPGFDPHGYELGNRWKLIQEYPEYKDQIIYLTGDVSFTSTLFQASPGRRGANNF